MTREPVKRRHSRSNLRSLAVFGGGAASYAAAVSASVATSVAASAVPVSIGAAETANPAPARATANASDRWVLVLMAVFSVGSDKHTPLPAEWSQPGTGGSAADGRAA